MKTLIRYSIIIVAFLAVFSKTYKSDICCEANDKLHVRVGVYDNKPKIYKEGDEIKGLFADIVNYIAKQEDWNLEYVYGTWAEGLERLEQNEIDMMVDVAISKDRKDLYDFNNETVLINWATIYTRPDVDIQSIYDLEGKKVAVMKKGIHYTGPLGIKSLIDSFYIENVTFVDVNIYADVFELIDRGEVDAGVVNRIFGIYNEPDYNVTRSNVVFNPIELKFAFPKEAEKNQILIPAIDTNLKELKQDANSIYYESLKIFLPGSRYEIEVVPTWIYVTGGGVGVSLLMLFTALIVVKISQRNLEQTVFERTEQLEESNERYKKLYKESQKRIKELEILTKAAVNRELRIKELKEIMNRKKKKSLKNDS